MATAATAATGYLDGTFAQEELLENVGMPEIDDALLMELLDETVILDEPEDERFGSMLRSLEAEIGLSSPVRAGGIMPAERIHSDEECEDCGLETVSSDLDSYECSTLLADDSSHWWAEMELARASPGGEYSDWYMDDVSESGCSSLYYIGDNCMEQVYISLWE